MTALEHQVTQDLDYLIGAWPSLVTLAVPGTSSPTRRVGRRAISDAVAALRAAIADREHTEDRRARELGVQPVPPTGFVPAPVRVNVLDALADFAAAAELVAGGVTQAAGVERPPSVTSSWTDPRPYLQLARAWLSVGRDADPELLGWVASHLHPLASRVALALGEVHDGQVLEAVCPWCEGRTRKGMHQRTLVVLSARARLEQAGGDGPVIICRGDGCYPSEQDCGLRVGDHPAWPEREWEWLAKRLLPIRATS